MKWLPVDSLLWPLLLLASIGATKAQDFVWPVQNPVVTQQYGERDSNRGEKWSLDYKSGRSTHTGVDLVSSSSLEVNPTANGTVAKIIDYASSNPKAHTGRTVIIQHDNGKYSLYGHLASINATLSESDIVTTATVLGKMGEMGKYEGSGYNNLYAYPSHLHFEIKDQPNITDETEKHPGYTPGHPDLYGYHDPREYIREKTADDSGVGTLPKPLALTHSLLPVGATVSAQNIAGADYDGQNVGITSSYIPPDLPQQRGAWTVWKIGFGETVVATKMIQVDGKRGQFFHIDKLPN